MNTIQKKKALGQHFLRKQSVVDHMIDAVTVTPQTSVMEIGCGDGFLTRAILEQTRCAKLTVFEIDPDWAGYVREKYGCPRLNVYVESILDADWADLYAEKPWVLLANLPYQITFPILFKLVDNVDLFEQGVMMVQEEVAQKMVATRGKALSATSLYLQYSFDFRLLDKVEPGAFDPPPKVFSRLVYFEPKRERIPIPDAGKFWKFVKLCFKRPRQTLRNNLRQTHYAWQQFDEKTLGLRAQQLTFDDFVRLWKKIG